MSQTQTAKGLWTECPHDSPWRHENPRSTKRKKHETPGWPELKSDKKVLDAGDANTNAWGEGAPLPPPDAPKARPTDDLDEAVRIGKGILRDLNALREAQDAPDFTRRPTDEAYKAAHESLKDAYTHYVGSAPAPAIAPDGDGGLVVEWKSGKREVRLVVPPDEVEKSYIFSRGDKTAKVDYDISGSVLARQLCVTFAE